MKFGVEIKIPTSQQKQTLQQYEILRLHPVEFFIHEYTLYTVAVSLLRGSKERC
jgi:hypothetical protein